MHILLATDADWIVDEVTAALGGPDTRFTVSREGRLVSRLVGERHPNVVIADLQVGSMGGVAISMALRLDESAGVLPRVPVVLLLDRGADVYLAQRSEADAWLVKPLDALRLRRAVAAATSGSTWFEGVPAPTSDADGGLGTGDEQESGERAEEEPATAG